MKERHVSLIGQLKKRAQNFRMMYQFMVIKEAERESLAKIDQICYLESCEGKERPGMVT